MKKIFLLLPFLLLLTGCGQNKESADSYVGETITSLKEDDSEMFSLLLDEGIAECNSHYTLQFPDELYKPYQDFLQAAFQTVTFEVNQAKETKDGYKVQVSYTPIHISNTLKEADNAYLCSLESPDFVAEATGMLKNAEQVLAESPEYQEETLSVLNVTESKDGYTIPEEEIKSFLESVLYHYMVPYEDICSVYNNLNYFQSYLDALYKGDVEQYARHTGQTVESAQAWYEMDTFDPPSDLSTAYADRYKEALKSMMKQCQYTLGAPQLTAGNYDYASMNYSVTVTYRPNTSLVNACQEFEQGTYYSVDEASAALVQAMEKYAASPTFGEETSTTVHISTSSFLSVGQEDSELGNLFDHIFPWS